MKKIFKRTVCFAAVICMLAAPVYVRAEEESYPTGLIWDDWETIEDNFDVSWFAESRIGDVDGDSRIKASDARLCLRASAQLEELSFAQQNAADVNSDDVVNSMDARLILRASAEIERLPDMTPDGYGKSFFTIGPLVSFSSTAYYWQAQYDEDVFEVREYRIVAQTLETGAIGNDCLHYFRVKVKNEELLKTGDKKITFKLSNGSGKDVIDEFCVAINY